MGRFTSMFAPRSSAPAALTAAATIISAQTSTDPGAFRSRLLPDVQEWQNEVWGFYDSLGIFRNACTWKSDMLSRVRLKAAKRVDGSDEPQFLTSGPAYDIVNELDPATQSSIMSNLTVYLAVPGEGYVVGEEVDGKNRWQARSTEEVRYRPNAESRLDGGTASPYEVVDERSGGNTVRWRRLAPNSLVVRVWRPHKRWFHVADSSARTARSTMRELELVNRRFQAEYMSRLASAGVFAMPSEVVFPVREEFKDAPDPFMAEWIEIAAEAIKTPGSAASLVPIPLKMPGEFIDKLQHIDFSVKLDDNLIEKRGDARRQLAVDLDVPPESLLGMADANHWTGWLIEESGFKQYLAPDCELMCGALTTGYLLPRLEAAGEDTDGLVIWYDASEIILRPDRSKSATEAYDRGEIDGDAYRREIGMDDADKPKDDELAHQILIKLALAGGTNALAALKELTGVDVEGPPPAAAPSGVQAAPTEAPAASGTAGARDIPVKKEPPAPDESKPAQAAEARLFRQASLPHALRVSLAGRQLLHPIDCQEHLVSCPVTHATWGSSLLGVPGSHGVYQCWLSPSGEPMIGGQLRDADVIGMLPTLSVVTATGR